MASVRYVGQVPRRQSQRKNPRKYASNATVSMSPTKILNRPMTCVKEVSALASAGSKSAGTASTPEAKGRRRDG